MTIIFVVLLVLGQSELHAGYRIIKPQTDPKIERLKGKGVLILSEHRRRPGPDFKFTSNKESTVSGYRYSGELIINAGPIKSASVATFRPGDIAQSNSRNKRKQKIFFQGASKKNSSKGNESSRENFHSDKNKFENKLTEIFGEVQELLYLEPIGENGTFQNPVVLSNLKSFAPLDNNSIKLEFINGQPLVLDAYNFTVQSGYNDAKWTNVLIGELPYF